MAKSQVLINRISLFLFFGFALAFLSNSRSFSGEENPSEEGVSLRVQEKKVQKVRQKNLSKYIDQRVQTVMEVRAIRYSKSKAWCYLESTKKTDDLKKSGLRNVTLVFKTKGRNAFRFAGIDDPAKKYSGKRIQVSGTVQEKSGKLQIEILEKKQIKIVGIRPKKN